MPLEQTSNGVFALLSVVYDGNYFGERALLFDAPRAASAAARTFSELLKLPRKDFNEVLQQHPSFAAELRRRSRASCRREGSRESSTSDWMMPRSSFSQGAR